MKCNPRRIPTASWCITAGAALLFWPSLTTANPIGGMAILDAGNGTVLVSGNGVTSGCIIWSTGVIPPPPACPTSGNGTFTVDPGSTMPPFTIGDTGTIANLNFNSISGGPLTDFLVIDGVHFDLTGIAYNTTGSNIGECGPTLVNGLNWDSPGASCVPAGSPIQLLNGLSVDGSGNANTVSATFTVYAEAYTGSSGVNYSTATPYIGVFTTQSSSPITGNIQTLLQTIMIPGGTVSASWSANFSPAPPGLQTSDTSFQIRYASNLEFGESYVDVTNTGANGAQLLGPGFGGNSGNICVNVYTFDAGEELISCCSCLATPDQTVNLGVNRDLTSRTLTGEMPDSVTIKLLLTLAGPGGAGTSCTNSAANATAANIVPGMAAWGTTLHATASGTFDETETRFTPASLSTGELASITGRCASIIGNGSGSGICSSCRPGALGANRLSN